MNLLHRPPVLALRLLGGASLEAADGPIVGRATQRHRLAVLALLAIAAERGQSRDRLMAVVWPERDTEPARHLLNQAVHSLRKTLGAEAILSVNNDLRLNPDVVSTDVIAFEEARARGEHEAAVALYRGPFLDGFFLPDASEFEAWADRERDRLAAAYAHSLEALAEAAERKGETGRAVDCWRTLAAQQPFDSRIALRLMQALDAAGNRAGALQHASVHERLLRAEFGVEPAGEVRAWAARLRQEPAGRIEPVAAVATRVEQVDSPTDAPTDAAPHARETAESERAISPPLPAPAAGASSSSRSRRAAWYGGAALLSAAALAVALWRGAPREPSPRAAAERVIAVLPLASHTADADGRLLAEGMTEQLVVTLARTQGLRVIGRSSVFALGDRRADARGVADRLGAEWLLEGAVQKAGSRLRLQVRLVAARDGTTRWAQTYDHELRDVFAVQDEIARSVARELGLRLGAATSASTRRVPTRSVAAYELYLRGSDRSLVRTDSGLRRGLEYFGQAIALDSSYAAAWAGMARMHNVRVLVATDAPRAERARWRALAEAAAEQAVALDDSLAEAHGTLGAIRMYRLDLDAAERHLRRALALDPGRALTHEVMVRLLLWTGRPDDALVHGTRAVELDPLSPTARVELARALLGAGRCEAAHTELRTLASLRPPLARTALVAAQCHARAARWAEAIETLRPQAERGDRHALGLLAYSLGRAGRRDEALRVRAGLLERWQQGTGEALEVALAHAGLGDFDAASAWLDRAVDDGSLGFALMAIGPPFEDARGDRRFDHLRERIGIGTKGR